MGIEGPYLSLWNLRVPSDNLRLKLYYVSCSSYTFLYYNVLPPGSERSGEDGVQGGELELHGDGLREARHQGLHLDAAQGAGGVGRQLQVDRLLPVVTVLLWTIASLLLNPHRIGSTQIVLMLDALSWPMWLTTEQSAINISRKSLVWIYFLVWCR